MKEITLSNTDKKACVDGEPGEEFDHLSRFVWSIAPSGYARTCVGGKWVNMHSMLTKPRSGMCVDHINRNRLDNRKANLRVCSRRVNNLNRSHHKEFGPQLPDGVTFNKRMGMFVAQIQRDKKKRVLGRFSDIQSASDAYQKAARELYPEDFE